jgi:hypothetical protein
MSVRLAFSVAIQVDAEILLIDEVLAVGDAAFQQKCFDVFNRMRDEGRTIIFVTHDMSAVTRFCHRARLIERGEIVSIGDPTEVADRYLEIAFGRAAGYEDDDVGSTRMGDGTARISDVWLGDDPAERRAMAPQSEPLTLKVLVKFNADVLDPALSMTLLNEQRQPVVVATTAQDHERTGSFSIGDHALFSFSFHNMLAPGRYHPIFTITHRGEGLDVIDRYTGTPSFVVSGLSASGGMVEIPVQTDVMPAAALPPSEIQQTAGPR